MSQADSRLADAPLTRRTFLVTAAALAGAAATGISACGSSSEGEAATSLLRYGEAGSFATFNPWAQTLNEQSVANQVFSRLVYKAADGSEVGDMAKSWKLSEDGQSMRIDLRPGVRWQDGKELVADDFVTMYGYLSDPALKSDQGVQKVKELFAPVTAVKAPDPATVVMEFSSPVPYVFDLLTYWYAVRFPDPDDTNFLKSLPVGTGPFKMTKFTRGQSASFDAFPDYYAKDRPKLDKFQFSIFASGSNVVSNLRSNQIDGVLINNAADVKPLQEDPAYYFNDVRLGVWLVQVNVAKPPFDKVEVRQALSYSMNRPQFAEAGNFGLEEPVTSPFFTAAATGYVEELVHAQAFDLDKARSLLDSAGVEELDINYPTPTSFPNLQTYGEIWQSDLAKIGVNMKIQAVDTARWTDLGAGEVPDADVVPWQVSRCLLDGAVFFSANAGYRGGTGDLSRFGYRNPTLEKLIKQGATETDEAKRKRIYQRLNEIVVNDAYNISTVTFSETWAWASKVTGEKADLAGNLMLAEASLKA